MRIVVTGLIGQYAFGGVTWDYIQYALGFRALGHDVWYLEDTSDWAYNPVTEECSADCTHNVNYLSRIMGDFDMGDRWIYRNGANGEYHGIADQAQADKILAEADVLANVSGACWLRPVTNGIKMKLFLDGDPMFTQIKLARGDRPDFLEAVRAHDKHYTFGLNVGRPGCKIPTNGLNWQPTVQPIALDLWQKPDSENDLVKEAWTTVMNWASYAPQEFEGESYGQKDIEFQRFSDLPRHTGERFVLAMGQGPGRNRPTAQLEGQGWKILEPDVHLPDYISYRNFLTSSKAEWSIAKNGYVQSHSGWFSCRSACYLAAGKPVVVQDTGWSEHLPSGEGAVAFATLEEAAQGIERVAANYEHHSAAAREFAAKHFEASKVCGELLE